MTLREMLELINEYIDDESVDPDTEVEVAVWHEDETAEMFPATMVSGHVTEKNLTIWAQGDEDEEGAPMPKHETQTVKPGDDDIPSDVKLAPLILLLWDRDITTCQYCQKYRPGEACIEFPGTRDVVRFLKVAQQPYRVELETWDEGEEGEQQITVRLLVLFPTKDIPRLMKAFTADHRQE
jgi:hypothetical protein